MSKNLIATNSNACIAYSDESASNLTNALADLTTFRSKIRLDGKSFQLVSGETLQDLGKILKCIIIGTSKTKDNKPSKRYFESKYSGSEGASAPRCRSFDGIKPDFDIPNPICELCAACRFNVWGTGDNGKGRACKDYIRLVLYFPQQLDTEDVDAESLHIYRFDVPAASLTQIGAYADKLKRNKQLISFVITEISFIQTEQFPKLQFKNIAPITQNMLKIVRQSDTISLAESILRDYASTEDAAMVMHRTENDESIKQEQPVKKPRQTRKSKTATQATAKEPQAISDAEIENYCGNKSKENVLDFTQNFDAEDAEDIDM